MAADHAVLQISLGCHCTTCLANLMREHILLHPTSQQGKMRRSGFSLNVIATEVL